MRKTSRPPAVAARPSSAAVRDRARFEFSSPIAALLLAAAFAGAAFAFDSRAESSFDAPKRIVALFAVAAAALAAFRLPLPREVRRRLLAPFEGWRDVRLPAALAAAALLLAIAAAAASPRRALSLDALRPILVFALLLPLGASRAVGRHRGLLLAAFFGCLGIDAAVSVLQARGLYQPFSLVTRGAREATGAFAGNVGYLAIALALAAVAAVAFALSSRAAAVRLTAGALALLFGGALLVNRNLTSISAFAAGAAVVAFAFYGRKAAAPLAAAVVLGGAFVAVYAPMRARAVEVGHAIRSGEWDALLSYRTAPWAASLQMLRERPLAGFGPGTFEAEFVPHRLKAEISLRRRLASPLVTSSYAETHCDYLQPFADAGAPAGVASLAAAALLFLLLARHSRATRAAGGPERFEAVLLLALLAAGATAALTWFPLQRPITAIPLLLAAGRAWRVAAEGAETETRVEAEGFAAPAGGTWTGRILLAAVLSLLLWPESTRYEADRELRAGHDALRLVLTSPEQVPDPAGTLERISLLAAAAAAPLPGDPRPQMLEGSALLVRGEAGRALAAYRAALALGERGETDLNLARAEQRLGREEAARTAFLRAAWVSPLLLQAMLPDDAQPAAAEMARLEAELKAGRLAAPPPLPGR